MLLRDAVIGAQVRQDTLEDKKKPTEYEHGFAEGIRFVLEMLAECEDIEVEELT